MDLMSLSKKILQEIKISLEAVSEEDVANLSQAIKAASRIFVAGRGRSELILKAFAMRLVHLGLEVFVVGEAVTPAIKKGDLLLIASGSGQTPSLIPIAQKARKKKAKVALVTAAPKSRLSTLTDVILVISAPSPRAGKSVRDTKRAQKATEEKAKSLQPLASLFEQALLILLDSIALGLKGELGVSETEMWQRHANLQ